MNTRNGWKKALMKYWQMYLLLIPVIVYYIIFKAIPHIKIKPQPNMI